jgi:pimeloyl-ACP methyl ester carboxylesterase
MVLPWIASLFGRSSNRRDRRASSRRERGSTLLGKLAAEALEDRIVPAPLPLYSGEDYLGDIAVFNRQNPADTNGVVDPNLQTWLVIHGRGSERDSDDMLSLSLALAQARAGDQVLTLDWSERADGALAFNQDRWIVPIAEAAADVLQEEGFSGGNLNVVGHSWGAYIGAELAERLPGGSVNSIVALDPGRDGLAEYNPEAAGEIDFARNSGYSWAFFESGGDPLGSRITPPTADEQFVIRHSGHGDVTEVFAGVLRLPDDNPMRQSFDLDRLVTGDASPWALDRYDRSGDIETPSAATLYDAVLEADHSGRDPFRLRYFSAGIETDLRNGGDERIFHGLRFETSGQFVNGPVRIGLAPTNGEAFTPLILFAEGVSFNDDGSFIGHGTMSLVLAGHAIPLLPGGQTVRVSDWLDDNGNLSLSIDSVSFGLGGVQFEASGLNLTYTSDDRLSLRGSATLGFGEFQVTAALGNGQTPGILIHDGELEGVHASLGTTPLAFGPVTITPSTFIFDYDATANRYAITGGAALAFGGQSISVDLGDSDTDGLVLVNGQLQSLDMKVSADFDLKGLRFGVRDLTISYDRLASRFAMSGDLFLSTGGASPTLSGLTASLGNAASPGLVIVNGQLESMNIAVSGSFNLFGVTLTAESLSVQYSRSTGILQLQGGVAVQLSNIIRGSVSLPNGGIVINTQTGQVEIHGLRLEFDVQLGAFRIDDLFVEYTRSTSGQISIAAGGVVTLPGGIAIGGQFSIVNGRFSSIALSYDAGSSLGIALGNSGLYLTKLGGSLRNLDNVSQLTVSASAEVTFGKSVNFLGKTGKLFVATGTLTVSPQRLSISGDVDLVAIKDEGDTEYNGLLGEGSIDLSLDWTRGIYRASVTVEQLWNIFNLEGSFTFTESGDFTIRGSVAMVVPDVIPVIGGMTLGGAGFYFQVRPNTATLTDDYAAAWIDLGFLGQYGFKVDFTGDFAFLDSEDIASLGSDGPRATPSGQFIYAYHFNVPENVTFARFQVTSPILTSPLFLQTQGQMIGVTNTVNFITYAIQQQNSTSFIIPADQFSSVGSRYKDSEDSWVLMLGRADGTVIVPRGQYTVYVTSLIPLVETLAPTVLPFYQYRKPTIEITGVETDDSANLHVSLDPASYAIGSLPTATTGSKTTIRLYYDDTPDGSRENPSGYDGIQFASLPYATRSGGSTVIANSYTWRELLSLSPNPYRAEPYYIFAVIDDGVNEPVFSAYSAPVVPPEPVTIGSPSVQGFTPQVPVVFSAASGNAITVSQLGFKTPVRVVLESSHGGLLLPGDDHEQNRIELEGTAGELTALLDGLRYRPDSSGRPETLIIRASAVTPKEYSREVRIDLVPSHTDLAVSLQAPAGPVAQRSAVEIVATLTNQQVVSGRDAAGVRLNVPMPAGLTLRSATPSIGTYDAASGVWSVGTLPLGASAQLVLAATVDEGTDGRTLLIGASAVSNAADLQPVDNTFAVRVDVSGQLNSAPTEILLSNTTIDENSTAGSVVGTLSTVDSPLDTHTYELVQNPGNRFVIAGIELRVASGAALNHEALAAIPLIIRSIDQGGLAVDREMIIAVADLNEPPSILPIQPRRVAEDEEVGLTIPTIDADAADHLTFRLLSEMENGPVLEPDGQFRWTPAEADGGNVYLFTVEVTDGGGLTTTRSFTITVDEVNRPPVFDAIPPIVLNEGELATFLARTVDPDVPVNALTYELVSGPAGATIDASTGQFTWLAADDGVYHGVVRVTDNGEPGRGVEQGFTITVNNVPPQVSVEGPAGGVRGQPRTFLFRSTDASTLDQSAGFTYVINWGDGTRLTVPGTPDNGTGAPLEHVYPKAGTFTITVTALDKNGAASEVDRHPIRIRAMQVQDGTLVIGGTLRDDRILVSPNGPDQIKVHVGPNTAAGARISPTAANARETAIVSGVERIIVYGQAGDDDIRIGSGIHLPAELYGGAGDDRLYGGSGFNVLSGGTGNDSLHGGLSRDILIGGRGADRLTGGANDDILFGGYFRHGATISDHPIPMPHALDIWTSNAGYSDRVERLRAALLNPSDDDSSKTNVRNDLSADVLIGSAGLDWFLLQAPGKSLDKAIDRFRVELVD